MSLILDALRKSANERSRGTSPTLSTGIGYAPRRSVRGARVPIALAVVAGTGALAWWAIQHQAPPAIQLASDQQDSGATPAAPGNTVAPLTAGPHNASLAANLPPVRAEKAELDLNVALGDANDGVLAGGGGAGGGPSLPMPAMGVYTPEPGLTPTTASIDNTPAVDTTPTVTPGVREMASAESAVAPEVPIAATVQPFAPAIEAAQAPVPAVIPTIDELSYDLRRELPDFEVTMYVYDSDPAKRFVIIDGKRYPGRDGERNVGGNTILQEIRRDALLMESNGTQFLLPRRR